MLILCICISHNLISCFLSPFFSSFLSSFSHNPYCASTIFSTLSLHYLLILDIFFSFFLILSFLFSLFSRFPSLLFPFLFPPQLIIPFFLLSSLPPFPFPPHFFSSLLFSLLSSLPLSLSPIPFSLLSSFALKVRLQSLLISSNDLSHTQQLLRTEFQESQNVANERRNQVRHLP